MPALLGIGGTLVGTVLGWLLNNWTKAGKLTLFVVEWKDDFTCDDGGYIKPCQNKEKINCYSFSVVLDIYNSSSEPKIMRDINVAFQNKRAIIKSITPKDDATKKVYSMTIHYEDAQPMNIPAKSVVRCKFLDSFWHDNLHFILDVDRVYLSYIDERGKTKKKLLHRDSYKSRFEDKQEDLTNGQTQNAQH